MSDSETKIIMYGTSWCFDSRKARRIFDENNIAYEYIDIDIDLEARKIVEQLNNGYRSVPTIIFPDGSKLVEPSKSELLAKLGITV